VSNQKQEKKDKNKIYLGEEKGESTQRTGNANAKSTLGFANHRRRYPIVIVMPCNGTNAQAIHKCVRRKNGFEITNTLQHNRTFHFCICLHVYVDINIFLAQKRTFTHNLDIPMLEIQKRPSILFVLFNASLSLCNSSVAKLFCLSRWLPYGPGILAQQLPTTRTMTGRCMQ